MRTKIVVALTAGTLGLSGLALAGPALAAGPTSGSDGPTASASSPVERIKQALAGLVADETLTQAQADKVAETLAAQRHAGPGRPGGPGGPGGLRGFGREGSGPGRFLSPAAQALGMSEDELRTALRSGASLASIAKERNVAVDTVVEALVKAAKERLDRAVETGRLTQAQADAMTADLEERITERIDRPWPARPWGGDRRSPGQPQSPATTS